MVNWLLIALLIILIIILVFEIKSKSNIQDDLKKTSMLLNNVDKSQFFNDMTLINNSIERSAYVILSKYLNRTVTFSENSPNPTCVPGNYRGLIEALMNPSYTQLIPNDDGTDEKRTFFSIFAEQVYLSYISTTSSVIKNLLFKWHTGFNYEDYQQSLINKKIKPSALPYILEFLGYWVTNKYSEVKSAEAELFEHANNISDPNNTAEAYTKLLEKYNVEAISKIYSNIYHMYGVDAKSLSVTQKSTPIKTLEKEDNHKKEVKNEFTTSFNEQNK